MSWTGRKVLVTGAGGFIGSHLCEELIELGAQVTAFLHYNSRDSWGNLEFLSADKRAALEVVAGNVEDSRFVDSVVQGKDVVFHLAALIGIPYSYVAPGSYVRTNIEGLQLARSLLDQYEALWRGRVERMTSLITSTKGDDA